MCLLPAAVMYQCTTSCFSLIHSSDLNMVSFLNRLFGCEHIKVSPALQNIPYPNGFLICQQYIDFPS
jgi:hypothetical protein